MIRRHHSGHLTREAVLGRGAKKSATGAAADGLRRFRTAPDKHVYHWDLGGSDIR
jgi:hypothetical protein